MVDAVLAHGLQKSRDTLQDHLNNENQLTTKSELRFTLTACLPHLERYDDMIVAYEQAIAEKSDLHDEGDLNAARPSQQPDGLTL
jgi:hypothetical protein